MSLKSVHDKSGKKGKDLAKILKSVTPTMEPGLASKMINGQCNPTPAQFALVCEFYDKQPTEIFDAQDVDYGITVVADNAPPLQCCPRAKKKDKRNATNTYKITVRIPRDMVKDDSLIEALHACGYAGITDWTMRNLRKLMKHYKKPTNKTAYSLSLSAKQQ